jgi:pimeloyl-ACP methyl ester carboxylesterase
MPVESKDGTRITLVLLPGMDGTGELFVPFVDALGTAFDVVVVRYPPTEPLDYAALERVARQALPPDAPYVLLAESFSGPVAVAIAASRPPGLIGLILCCSFVRNPLPLLSGLRGMVRLLPFRWVPVRLLGAILMGRHATPSMHAALAHSLEQVSTNALKARMLSVLAADVSARLAQVDVPVLYLRAADDRVVPTSASRLASTLLPEMHVVALQAPHFLLQAVPAQAARHIVDFVDGISTATDR